MFHMSPYRCNERMYSGVDSSLSISARVLVFSEAPYPVIDSYFTQKIKVVAHAIDRLTKWKFRLTLSKKMGLSGSLLMRIERMLWVRLARVFSNPYAYKSLPKL